VEVENASNKDWEDLTSDGTHLYIADVGNNLSKRKKLKIYKVEINKVLENKTVAAEKITISYMDQLSYPPGDDSLYYDAEGIAFKDDSLWVFTKTKASPWNGISFIYKVPIEKGKYVLEKKHELYIGDNGWWSDAITAADYFEGKFYLTTYNRVIITTFDGVKLEKESSIEFDDLTQKESILVKNRETIFYADEKHRVLGGGKLYKMKLSD
jgi:hypothetical protein